jgi:integrin alpha FG-GAP repeat containing protein 1
VSVGASRYPPFHTTDLESIIPNSQLLINPPSPPDNGTSPPSTVRARSTEWRSELYLHPGDWVPWVGAAVVGTVIVLGGVVLGLHEQEKVSAIRLESEWC